MELSELSLPQQLAAHELELHALRNEVRHTRQVIAALIELLERRTSSPDFHTGLKALMAERDRILRDE